MVILRVKNHNDIYCPTTITIMLIVLSTILTILNVQSTLTNCGPFLGHVNLHKSPSINCKVEINLDFGELLLQLKFLNQPKFISNSAN